MLKTAFLLGLLAMAATGCGRNLYHYHRTVVGVDIAGNVAGETPSGHLTLGYSRRLVILMPPAIEDALKAKRTNSHTDAEQHDIPPTVFCTQVKASLGGVNIFREILATGAPADAYALQLAGDAAAVPTNGWRNRNFVCPGLVIPVPEGPSPTLTDKSKSAVDKANADDKGESPAPRGH